MRRDVLLSLVGFLGGFVVAALVFSPRSPHADGVLNESAPGAVETRRNDGASALEQSASSALPERAPRAKQAVEVLHDAIGRLRDLDTASMGGIVKALSKELRAAGPEGVAALQQYFRAGQDVVFKNGYIVVDGKMVHSLGTALLDSLSDWPADEANEIALEVLRNTSRRADAAVAIRLLEKNAPGQFRADAIETFQRFAGKPFEKGDWLMNDMLFDTMRRFKAAELLPAAEATLGNNGFETGRFITSLDALPADVRAGALQRLFANESVTRYLAMNPQAVQSLNYSEPIVAQGMAGVFATNMGKKSREDFVRAIGDPWSNGMSSTAIAHRVAAWQARVALLDRIAPHANTPALQERLQDAREALQNAIADPDANPFFNRGVGTLILGGITIKTSGTLQVIDTKSTDTTNKK